MTVICRACPSPNCGAVTQFTIIVDEVKPENNKEIKVTCSNPKCPYSFKTENCISVTKERIKTTPAEDIVINILMPKFGLQHRSLVDKKARARLRMNKMNEDEAVPAINNLHRLGVITMTEFAIKLVF